MSFKTAIIRAAGRSSLQLQKHAPTLMTAAGIAGFVGTTVLAARSTLQLEEVVNDLRGGIRDVDEIAERNENVGSKQHIQDKTYVYSLFAGRMIKLYGPAVTLGLTSGALIIGAHGIMKKRNAALAVAYTGLEKAYTAYRDRVAEVLGEEAEEQIHRPKATEVEVIDPETGEKEVKLDFDPTKYSQYARFFDEYNKNWNPTAEFNLLFLRGIQNSVNDLLRLRGHVFLNEVYERLGMDHTKQGAVVGWILNGNGDGYIDFGMYDFASERARAFVNNQEPSILLDFNVDGTIYDKI